MIYADYIDELTQWEQWKADWVISHLQYVPLGEERESIRGEFAYPMTSERLHELFVMVNNNIPEPISHGLNYSQGDIQRKLNQVERDERK